MSEPDAGLTRLAVAKVAVAAAAHGIDLGLVIGPTTRTPAGGPIRVRRAAGWPTVVTFVLFGYFLLCMVTVTDRTAQHGPDAVAEPYLDGDSYLREADTADPDPDATRRRRPRIVAAGRYRDTRRSTTCGP